MIACFSRREESNGKNKQFLENVWYLLGVMANRGQNYVDILHSEVYTISNFYVCLCA